MSTTERALPRSANVSAVAGTAKEQSRKCNLAKLLADPSDFVASMAMESILHGAVTPEQCQQFIRDCQDSSDTMLRRRIQQLTAVQNFERLKKDFASELKSRHSNALLNCIMLLDRIYNPKSSEEYLLQLMRELYAGFNPGEEPKSDAEALAEFMRERNFHTPPLPWLNIGFFLLGDVLESGIGVPHLLTAVAAAVARSKGMKCAVCMSDGHLGLYFPSGDLIKPMELWNIKHGVSASSLHICETVHTVRSLLGLALSTSATAWSAGDVELFTSLLVECGLVNSSAAHLPYPFGDFLKDTGY